MRVVLPPRGLLIGSIALNAFLAAVLAVMVLHPPPPPPPPFDDLVALADRVGPALSPADAALLRAAAGRHAETARRESRTLRGMPDRVAAVLAAPEFDPEALRQLFEAASEAHHRIDRAFAEMMIEAAGGMSADGRAALARWRPPPPPGDREEDEE